MRSIFLSHEDLDGAPLGMNFTYITQPLASWKVQQVFPVLPSDAAVSTLPGFHLRVCLSETVLPLLTYAASRAFEGMTVEHLKLLWTLLEIPTRRPTRKRELVIELMQHVTPSYSEADAIVIVDGLEEQEETLGTAAVELDELAAALDEDPDEDVLAEAVELKEAIANESLARASRQAKSRPPSGASASVPPPEENRFWKTAAVGHRRKRRSCCRLDAR